MLNRHTVSRLSVFVAVLAATALLGACSSGPNEQQLQTAAERVDTFTRFTMEGNWQAAHNNLKSSYRSNCSETQFTRQLQKAMGDRPDGFDWQDPIPAEEGMFVTVDGTATTVSGTQVPVAMELEYLDTKLPVWVLTDLSVDGQQICV